MNSQRIAHTPAQDLHLRAAVYRRFGAPEVVHTEASTRPAPGVDEVLVRVHASTVSSADHRARTRDVPRGLRVLAAVSLGIFRPRHRVLGMAVAGVIEAVGAGVTSFAPGDEVDYTADALADLVGRAESGRFHAVVDRTYDLADIVEAHRYVDAGHKRGNVVLRVTGS